MLGGLRQGAARTLFGPVVSADHPPAGSVQGHRCFGDSVFSKYFDRHGLATSSTERRSGAWGARQDDCGIRDRPLEPQATRHVTDTFNIFVQDEVCLGSKVTLTGGSKFEWGEFTKQELQPTLRGLWNASPAHGLWGGVSRAVRLLTRQDVDEHSIDAAIETRLSLIREKAFAEADRIREELAGQGVQLMDYKDPETGERRTKWEVKR